MSRLRPPDGKYPRREPGSAPPPAKRQVLFVCIGNSCRSQMAEGFARKYGADVMVPSSGGVAPAPGIAPLTVKVMGDRGISLAGHYPKSVFEVPGGPFDVVVNMSGVDLGPQLRMKAREWSVRDPIADPEPVYIHVADQIERLVQQLVLELRTRK